MKQWNSEPLDNNDYIQLIVEVSVTVYVFLLGLPTLVNQIFLPDDLRRMSKKNYMENTRWHLYALTGMLFGILILAIPFKSGLSDKVRVWLVTFLFYAMLIDTLVFLFANLIKSQGYRAKIIEKIKQMILRDYRKNKSIDPVFLDDLEYLGIFSKAGAETRIIIEALECVLTETYQKDGETFDNDILIRIIDILCVSVTNSVEPGSRENMVDVLTIFKSLLMDLSNFSTQDNQLIYGNETRKIKDCTFKIALTSLKRDYADMMPLVLNVLTLIPRSSDKLFDIGILAMDKGQFQIATNVLAEIMDRDNKDYLTMNNYLGLVAHFFFAGKAARRQATRSLERNKIKLAKKELDAGIEYHYIMSNFSTVDKMEQLLEFYFKWRDSKTTQ